MMSTRNDELLSHLIRSSTPYRDPLARVPWDRVESEQLWLPEEALSLYGLSTYKGLSEYQRRSLSHYEYIHLLLAGLWLEGLLMNRLVGALRNRDAHHLTYYLHELREEAGHSLSFLEFLRRCEMPVPENPFFGQRLISLVGRRMRFDGPAFWLAAMFAEELPDRINRMIRRHREGLCPAVVTLSTLQIIDAARHTTHARNRFTELIKTTSRAKLRLLRPGIEWSLRRYVQTLYFPPPSTYILAGLSPGRHWARQAQRNEHRWDLVYRHLRPSLAFLQQHGLNLKI
jgi:hypothetical protein